VHGVIPLAASADYCLKKRFPSVQRFGILMPFASRLFSWCTPSQGVGYQISQQRAHKATILLAPLKRGVNIMRRAGAQYGTRFVLKPIKKA